MFVVIAYFVGSCILLGLSEIFRRKRTNEVSVSEMATSDSAFECGVCNEDYDADHHKPLVLSCGHTFCLACLGQIAAAYDKKCPNCRTQIHQTVDQLAVNYALIPSVKKASSVKSLPESVDLCKNHGCQLDYFCVDCGDLSCRKCSRDLHLNHRVESVEDIMGDDSVAYARTELRQKIRGKLDDLKNSLSIPSEMLQLFEALKKCERELEDWHDFRQVMETSVKSDLEAWDDAVANPEKEKKKTVKDILRRLYEVKPPQIQNLSQIKMKLTELSKKAASLERLAEQKSTTDLASEASLSNCNSSELLPNNRHWTVTTEASIKNALLSMNIGYKPAKVSVVSLPSEPIKRLPARLDVLGNACAGAMEVKPLDFFWRASTGSDERLRMFIDKHGHKVSEFHGSPDDALLVCSASRQSPLSLGVRLCNMSDLDRCSALTVKPFSVCCIPGLPADAGARMFELGWRPVLWHFPDFHDKDLDWMMTILESFAPPPMVIPAWIMCAAILGIRLFRCYLPRCRLTEKGFEKLLERYPLHAPTICCETVSLPADSRTRLTAFAEKKEIQLQWEIPL